MPRTSADVVNEAIYMMGDKVSRVTGDSPTFDQSTAGIAAQILYVPTVEAVARAYEWDFARRRVSLTVSGNAAPFPMGYAFEYLYPTNGIEVWQILLPVVDPYDPLPINWNVGNTLVGDPQTQTKVIWTDVEDAVAIYNNNPSPGLWDAGFNDAVVRRLSSLFAMALAGRPNTMEAIQASSIVALQLATSRDA